MATLYPVMMSVRRDFDFMGARRRSIDFSACTPECGGIHGAACVDTISAGHLHTCGITLAGTVLCWGDNELGQSSPPDVAFSAVSAGGDHTCGIDTDGIVLCWGDGYDGQVQPP